MRVIAGTAATTVVALAFGFEAFVGLLAALVLAAAIVGAVEGAFAARRSSP